MDDFGGKLRQARERRGISLRQVASSTKIAPAALDALERNDISRLPGGIFSRAFVRSYALEVGLDPDQTVQEFLDRFDQEAPPTAESVAASMPEAEREFEQRQRRAARALTLTAVAIPVLIAALYFALRGRTAAQAGPGPAQVATAADPPPAAAAASAVPRDDRPLPSSAAALLVLEIRPRAICWVSARVDGRPVFTRIMRAGERELLTVQREAVIDVGDAGAFAYTVNGRDGKPIGSAGQKRTLTVTPATAPQFIR